MIKLVTFDLDNTLWDVDSIIRGAEAAMRAWLFEAVPEVVTLYDRGGVDAIRARVIAEHPDLTHDLSKLRTLIVTRAIAATGRSSQESTTLAKAAFDVFYEARHKVQYFPDALETLEQLAGRYQLAALSNGNADVFRLGLNHVFSFAYSSADVGASKPAPQIFHRALTHAGVRPHEAVHVGDHPHDDIAGASAVGMHTVWVRIPEVNTHADAPGARVERLRDLPAAIARLHHSD